MHVRPFAIATIVYVLFSTAPTVAFAQTQPTRSRATTPSWRNVEPLDPAWLHPLDPSETPCDDPTASFQVDRWMRFDPRNAQHLSLLRRAAVERQLATAGITTIEVVRNLISAELWARVHESINDPTVWTTRFTLLVHFRGVVPWNDVCRRASGEPRPQNVAMTHLTLIGLLIARRSDEFLPIYRRLSADEVRWPVLPMITESVLVTIAPGIGSRLDPR